MSIDYGLVIVIVAVLIFYLRLIILQRQRAKQLRQQNKLNKSKAGKGIQPARDPSGIYTVISRKPLDRLIGVMGLILVIFGLLVYAGFFSFTNASTILVDSNCIRYHRLQLDV